jgi:hypothetical protein
MKKAARFIARVIAVGMLLVPPAVCGAEPASYGVAIVSTSTGGGTQNVRITYADALPAPAGVQRRLQPFATPQPMGPGDLAPMHGKIGDKHRFWVTHFAEAPHGTNRVSSVNATLLFASEHGDLWIDEDVSSAFVATFHDSLVRDIENAYQTVHASFGQLGYTAKDVEQHTPVSACIRGRHASPSVGAFVPSRGELLSVLLVAPGKVRLGYSDQQSFRHQIELDCDENAKSNEFAGLIVIPVPSASQEREAADGFFVYDTADLAVFTANYVRHEIRAPQSRRQQLFLDEGLGTLAQDFAADRLFHKRFDWYSTALAAHTYLANPNAYNILGFALRDAKGPPADSRGTFGAVYLLQRYLYDTFGDDYLHRVVDTDEIGARALELATGLPIDELLRRFARNMLAPHEPGITLPLCAGGMDPFGNWRDLYGARLELLTRNTVDVAEGGVSFFISSRPIASVTSSKGAVSFVQVPYTSLMPGTSTTSCALK